MILSINIRWSVKMKILNLWLVLIMISMNAASITVYDRSVTNTRVGGYMDTEWHSEGTTNTFKAHRFILQAGSQLSSKVRFNSEVEFEYGGYVTNDDADDTTQEGEIKIEQAWVDFDANENLTLRTGIVLIPVGQLNIYHDSDLRDFTARPLVNRYIIPTTWMDTGIGGYGILEFGDVELTYEGYLTNGFVDDNSYSSSSGTRALRPNFKSDTNQGKAVSGRLGFSPNLNQAYGLSAYRGNSKQLIVALDGNYQSGPFGVKGELATYSDGYDNAGEGYYLEAKYNIAPYINMDSELNLLARYEYVDLLANDSSSGQIERTVVGVNIKPVQQLVYKIAYHFNTNQDSDTNDAIYASVAVGF